MNNGKMIERNQPSKLRASLNKEWYTKGYTKGYTFPEKSPLISLGYTLGYRKGYMVYPRMKLFFSQVGKSWSYIYMYPGSNSLPRVHFF